MTEYTLLKQERNKTFSEIGHFVFTHCEPKPGDIVQYGETIYTVKCRYWNNEGRLYLIVHQPPYGVVKC